MILLLILSFSVTTAASTTAIKAPTTAAVTSYNLTAEACMAKNLYKFCTPPDDKPLDSQKLTGYCCSTQANNTECLSDQLCTQMRNSTKDLSLP